MHPKGGGGASEGRKEVEEGKWKNWHRGAGKLNMLARLEQTKEKLAELEK